VQRLENCSDDQQFNDLWTDFHNTQAVTHNFYSQQRKAVYATESVYCIRQYP